MGFYQLNRMYKGRTKPLFFFKNRLAISMMLLCLSSFVFGQNKLDVSGQLSGIIGYAPNSKYELFLSGRYIPELDYAIQIDSTKTLDFEVSANISGSIFSDDFKNTLEEGQVSPYRVWARYTGSQYEVRVGLQKIDFGSASILRPLQWFNQIDPRDPLQLTNGVYGVLGRYYFLNNANIWLWGLYGNEKTRGFDALETYKKHPEFGGRFQYPVPKGELAFSYHHRTADWSDVSPLKEYERIPENRFALDGKWDVGIGIWFETSYIRKAQNLGPLTHQTLLNVGTDYTFAIGNGLNVVVEHLILAFDENAFQFENNSNITAATASYPLGFHDNLSSVIYYNWTSSDYTFFLNYSHQFERMTAYLFAFYNSGSGQQGIQQNDLLNTASGPGVQIMVVYKH